MQTCCGDCLFWKVQRLPDGRFSGIHICGSSNGLVRNTMRGWWIPSCDSFKDKADVIDISDWAQIKKQLI
jgi:hypothetical protein